MRKLYTLLFISFFFLHCFSQPTISFQTVITGLTQPIEVVNAGDGSNRLFIVQQNGIIRVYDPANGGLQASPFVDISGLISTAGSEQGLLSLAFHPAYKSNGYFFVYYTNTSGDIELARYSVSANANVADAGSRAFLLNIPKPFANHNGGHLQFGADGYLYFATGDGGSANDPNNNAQNPLSLLGKMLRINVDAFATAPYYTVPPDNPFVGNAAYDSRIWSLGLRNPFRWSFDRLTGDIWIGDVGQGAKEEINFTPAASTGGENYGWRCYEGSIRNPNIAPCDPPTHQPPIFDYDNPASGAASVVGGFVYRGAEYPFFQGWYLATDVYTNTLFLVKPNGSGGWTVAEQASPGNFVVSFGEAEDGTLYAVSQGTNTVYKVVAADGALPVVLQQFSAKALAAGTALQWTTATEEPNSQFIIEYGTDGSRFSKAGEVRANGTANGATYSFVHNFTSAAPLFYRLLIVEGTGSRNYSAIVKVDGRTKAAQVYPTIIRDGTFWINGAGRLDRLQVLNSNGSVVLEKPLAPFSSPAAVQLPPLAKGIYFIRIYNQGSSSQHRIVVE